MTVADMRLDTKEFIGERAQLYTDVLNEFPLARKAEIDLNMRYLKPQEGEKILEIGAGSGMYSKVISDMLGSTGELIATDPSADQLRNIQNLNRENIRIVQAGADQLLNCEELVEEKNACDAIWSLGAFHHCMDKSTSFKNFHYLLKNKGRLLLCDVFSGSLLADYFDAEVARYSVTGHEVAFLTQGFARSLCFLYGFSEPTFHELDYHWSFDTRKDLGDFMYKIHGMTKTTPEKCLEKVEELMEVECVNGKYILHVPLTILEAYKK